MRGLIDTHCHLNDPEAFPDPLAAVAEAQAAGVERLVVVGIDANWNARARDLAEASRSVWFSAGWHPTSVRPLLAHDMAAELRSLDALLDHPRCVALGEIGLDYHWDFTTPEEQDCALHAQLDLAAAREAMGKPTPLIFHCREAYGPLLDRLESRGPGRYLLHCFGGTIQEAERALALGAKLGVDGPVTYPKAESLREVIRATGLAHWMLETDAPWMSPVPYRGKPNHPRHLPLVAEGLARALGITPDEVAIQTTQTATEFFRFPAD